MKKLMNEILKTFPVISHDNNVFILKGKIKPETIVQLIEEKPFFGYGIKEFLDGRFQYSYQGLKLEVEHVDKKTIVSFR
jgi:hypothetical protein